jgi:hypothetical protein
VREEPGLAIGAEAELVRALMNEDREDAVDAGHREVSIIGAPLRGEGNQHHPAGADSMPGIGALAERRVPCCALP